ncbi:helicase [Saitoella coloradoensis]
MPPKPFKPPSFIRPRPPSSGGEAPDESIAKKPRLDSPLTNPASPALAITTPPIRKSLGSSYRKPLLTVTNAAAAAKSAPNATVTDGPEMFFNVLWRKQTTKKHKTWDGDGILVIQGNQCTLQDMAGKDLAKTTFKGGDIGVGTELFIGGKEVEVDSVLAKSDYMSGKPFLNVSSAEAAPPSVVLPVTKKYKAPLLESTVLPTTKRKVPTPRHAINPDSFVLPRPKGRHAQGKTLVDVVVDPFIGRYLRPHQKEGVQFMYESIMGMRDFDGTGCLLADEMGLGKTLQTIALIWTLLKQTPFWEEGPVVQKALIVCPVTLIGNWIREFRKWLGKERIAVLGCETKKDVQDFKMGNTYNVMVIGYEKLRLLQEDMKKLKFDIIVCDEGHRLKAVNNKLAAAIRSLSCLRRIILSGTPIQNDLGEFWTMSDFINPGLLQSYATFKKEFEGPVIKSRQPGAMKKDIEKGKARSEALTALTRMFVLRRTADVLSNYLLPKVEYVVFCRPTAQQVQIYKALLDSPALRRCTEGSDMSAHLQAITALKKVCNAPSLLLDKSKDEEDDFSLYANLAKVMKGFGGSGLRKSGKLHVLERLVTILRGVTDEKIVIVSGYTQTLDVIQDLLGSKGMSYLRLDGSTPSNKRQEYVDKFNRTNADEAFAFLLSAKSGGAGINLVGASRLVLFDTDWNPSVDLQAMARIHRDGQKRQVYIYRFLTTGCIDEKIYQRQVTKQGLSDQFMDQKKTGGNSFTQAELRDLFTLHTGTECQTHELLGCTCASKGDNIPDTKDDAVEIEVEEDADEDLPEIELPGFKKASNVTEEEAELDVSPLRKKNKMDALAEYIHVSPAVLAQNVKNDESALLLGPDDPASVVEDDILREILAEGDVSYLFGKKSG